MNLKGQNRYRTTHKESLSTNKLNQNILFTKNKKLINTMQCPLSLAQIIEKMTKGIKEWHHCTLILLSTQIIEENLHDMMWPVTNIITPIEHHWSVVHAPRCPWKLIGLLGTVQNKVALTNLHIRQHTNEKKN